MPFLFPLIVVAFSRLISIRLECFWLVGLICLCSVSMIKSIAFDALWYGFIRSLGRVVLSNRIEHKNWLFIRVDAIDIVFLNG